MIRVFLLSIALTTAFALPAAAHIQCWAIDVLIPYLQQEHGQTPVFQGTDHGGFPIQVWLSKDGEKWSFVTYRPPDQACLIASGWDMRFLKRDEPMEDKEA